MTLQSFRKEDDRLLRGLGTFTSDLNYDGQLYAAFLRSDSATGRLISIDKSTAEKLPGVRLVVDALQCGKFGLKNFPTLGNMPDQIVMPRPVMPLDIRHVGEILAMVVADDIETARDAIESISVTLESDPPEPQISDLKSADIAYTWEHGNRPELEQAFLSAKWIANVEAKSNRIIVHSMETRSALAHPDPMTGQILLHTASQGVHKIQEMIATAIGLEINQLRVMTPDVGGAFGMKLQAYPEQALIVLAAKLTDRPVKWVADRQESSLMDIHGRAQSLSARLAIDENGNFLALDIENHADLGAYATGFGSFTPSLSGGKVAGHVYQIPNICMKVIAHHTNTVPIDAYRGAGKPEMVYVLERAIEKAAQISGIDRIKLRRRNLVSPRLMPHPLPLGQKIDTGEFETIMDKVLIAGDWAGFEQRRRIAAKRGKLAGIGFAMHMHVSGGFTNELSKIQICPTGKVYVFTGTQNGGQGHETVFAQIASKQLKIGLEKIIVCQGDSHALSTGGGTGGSSSLQIAGVNIKKAAEQLLKIMKQRAVDHLEAANADITYDRGQFTVVGTDRRISIFELSQKDELSFGCDFSGDHVTFPNGAYVAEVEIDLETGQLDLVRFAGVDDIGTVINPPIALGQIHGGVVQGLGQAMFEEAIYSSSGQLINATMMDYTLPRADNFCRLDCSFHSVPTITNPLGAKGVGELGPAGALAPVVHAVFNALGEYDHSSIEMPLSCESIWRAMNKNRHNTH